jgi:hypothetical protein
MKRLSLIAQIAFFFLTLLAVAALWFLCDLMKLPKGWVVLAISIVTAEVLIRRFDFWRTGVESGLWIGGLCVFIVSLPSTGRPEAILAFVAAFAIAGARLRNPLFGAVAVALTLAYLGAKHLEDVALVAAAILSVVGSFLAARRLFAFIAVTAPVVGYLVGRDVRSAALLLFVAAAANLPIGIRTRERAALIAGAICTGIACYELRDLLPFDTEWKLIAAGAALLAIATILMRALRGRTTGITVTPMKPHELQDAMQIGAMLPMATPDATPDQAQLEPGGGGFGGAGASGQY